MIGLRNYPRSTRTGVLWEYRAGSQEYKDFAVKVSQIVRSPFDLRPINLEREGQIGVPISSSRHCYMDVKSVRP